LWLPLVLLVLPHLASAALTSCTGLNCQFCSVAQMVQNIINFLIQLSIPIAAALFAYAGFSYATARGNTTKIAKATGVFAIVGVGFILTLIGWLVINTMLSILLGNGPYSNGRWFQIPCVSSRDTGSNTIGNLIGSLVSGQTSAGLTAVAPTSPVATTPTITTPQGATLSASAAQQALTNFCTANNNANCITVTSSGNCSNQSNSSCTSLEGLQPTTIAGAEALQQQCHCSLAISGGTEAGHGENGLYTHRNGYKFDFLPSAALNNTITSWTSIGMSVLGPQYQQGNTVCTMESSHWDCAFRP